MTAYAEIVARPVERSRCAAGVVLAASDSSLMP
jgi:hypothetical protein